MTIGIGRSIFDRLIKELQDGCVIGRIERVSRALVVLLDCIIVLYRTVSYWNMTGQVSEVTESELAGYFPAATAESLYCSCYVVLSYSVVNQESLSARISMRPLRSCVYHYSLPRRTSSMVPSNQLMAIKLNLSINGQIKMNRPIRTRQKAVNSQS